jgi:hypothetical protein
MNRKTDIDGCFSRGRFTVAKKDPGESPGIKLLFRFQPVFLTGFGFLCNGSSGWMV